MTKRRRESREEDIWKEEKSRKETSEEEKIQNDAKRRNENREKEMEDIWINKKSLKDTEDIWKEEKSRKETSEEAKIQNYAKRRSESWKKEEIWINKKSWKETGEEEKVTPEEKAREESQRRSGETPEEGKITKKRCREDDATADEIDSKKHHTDPSEPPDPLAITNYQFYSELGEGSFGKVLLAKLNGKNPSVAIKVLEKKSKKTCRNIQMESSILRMAKENPYLCQGFAAFQTQSHAFLVMEFVSGGCLWDQLIKYDHLEMSRVLFYSAEMACGLEFLHSRDITHRDLKPENILLDQEGHIKISDFGLAVETSFGETITGETGTLGYMAPEIFKEEEYNSAVDWWSFGIITCEMATGRSPFFDGHDREKVITSIIRDEPDIPDWLSKDLQHLLQKLLMKEPHQRLGVYGDIRYHPFYSSINWVELEQKKIPPPFQLTEPSTEDVTKCTGKRLSSFLDINESTEKIHNIPDLSYIGSSWQNE